MLVPRRRTTTAPRGRLVMTAPRAPSLRLTTIVPRRPRTIVAPRGRLTMTAPRAPGARLAIIVPRRPRTIVAPRAAGRPLTTRCAAPTAHDRATRAAHDHGATCATQTTTHDRGATPTSQNRRSTGTIHDRSATRTTHDRCVTHGGISVGNIDGHDSQKRGDAESSKCRQTHVASLVWVEWIKPHSKNLVWQVGAAIYVQARFAHLSQAFPIRNISGFSPILRHSRMFRSRTHT